jgi:PIN domain nuclease of toxin-antitoxin system
MKLGKLTLKVPFEILFPGKLESLGFHFLPIEIAHIRETLSLPFHHNDPFDRMLIAQVRTEQMTLVSCDENCPRYEIPVIW